MEQRSWWKRVGLGLGVFTALVCALALAAPAVGRMMRQQAAESVRSAVLDAALQCCAIEGSYPPSLAYLEEHYGLTVNRSDFAITYESYAANVMPSVRVVPR